MTNENNTDERQIARYQERGDRFYARLRRRVDDWLERNLKADQKVREYLLLLPDLFVLLLRLLGDARIERKLRMQLLLAVVYVISPVDLIPDIMLPVGLLDDTVAVAFALTRLLNIMGSAGEEILVEHWEGYGDLLSRIQKIARDAESLLSSGFLERLRDLFLKKKA